ncbi:hypothetical protein C7E24_19880, partial [Stenotrophomonas maltophilia]
MPSVRTSIAWQAAVPQRGRSFRPRDEDAYRECRRLPGSHCCHGQPAAACHGLRHGLQDTAAHRLAFRPRTLVGQRHGDGVDQERHVVVDDLQHGVRRLPTVGLR